MEWITFAGSVLGGLIGGIFTFLGVKLTLRYEKEKEIKDAHLKTIETKPRFEIIDYLDFEATRDLKSNNQDCNVLLLSILDFIDDNGRARFFYDENALNSNNLIFVEYVFKNTGFTEVEDVRVASNLPKSLSIVEFEKKEIYFYENMLNYVVYGEKRYIKPGQTIRIRVYYIKDQIIESLISYPLTLWLHDVNGKYWEQNFGSPRNDIETSRLSDLETFKSDTSIEKAVECFKNPQKW